MYCGICLLNNFSLLSTVCRFLYHIILQDLACEEIILLHASMTLFIFTKISALIVQTESGFSIY